MLSSALNDMIKAIKEINNQASTEIIKTFSKITLILCPPDTKYYTIWDPDVLSSYLDTMDTTKSIHLSMKTASLIMLILNRVEFLKVQLVNI